MEFTEMRKSKEEIEAEKARRQQIRNLWQSAGVTDIRGFNNLIDEMKKVILEDMYESEMDTRSTGKAKKDLKNQIIIAMGVTISSSKRRMESWN